MPGYEGISSGVHSQRYKRALVLRGKRGLWYYEVKEGSGITR